MIPRFIHGAYKWGKRKLLRFVTTFPSRLVVSRAAFLLLFSEEIFSEGTLRANLEAAIKARFGSQIAFARAVGLHSVRVNRLCRGWIEPTPQERERIAETLRADSDWLFAALRIPAPKTFVRCARTCWVMRTHWTICFSIGAWRSARAFQWGRQRQGIQRMWTEAFSTVWTSEGYPVQWKSSVPLLG